jgi:hypothetical protein
MSSENNKEQQMNGLSTPGSSHRPRKVKIGELKSSNSLISKAELWITVALCIAVLTASALKQFVFNSAASGHSLAPEWLTFIAAGTAIAGVIRWNGRLQKLRLQRVFLWGGLLLMVWVANGLLFDLLTLVGLIGDPVTGRLASVYWPGLTTHALALAATVMLARLALARPATYSSTATTTWYAYAAFVLALPYPVFRILWALGGTMGIIKQGQAGQGYEPLLIAIPWLLAAVISLLLISPRKWIPRQLLLVAGWTATAIVAMIGPSAFWTMITKIGSHNFSGPIGMSMWVPCLFYTSWFLWALAAGAATRSYQLRTSRFTDIPVDVTGGHNNK